MPQARLIIVFTGLIALATYASVSATQIELQPSTLKTGSELIVHLSSTQYGNCWDGPLPFVSLHGVYGDALQVFITGTDYVECHTEPLDALISLGAIPSLVTTVQLYGCVDNPIPGKPPCSSVAFLIAAVVQTAIQPVPAITNPWTLLSLSLLLLCAGFLCGPRIAVRR